MEVKVIGSGAIWTRENSSCYVVDNNIMVDMPNGAYRELNRCGVNYLDINNILITHFHGDHYFDVPFYLLAIEKNNGVASIYCDMEGSRKIEELTALAFPNSKEDIYNYENISFHYDDDFNIDNHVVERVTVDHGNIRAFGYIIDNYLGFTGDTCLCSEVERMASICKHMIVDCSLSGYGDDKHMGVNDIIYLCNKYDNCMFYTAHMGDKAREELLSKSIENLRVLRDGDTLEI